MNLYLDEAGYTGADLINKDQPFFCLASVCFTEEELSIIREKLDLPEDYKEIHFIKLHKSKEGRSLLKKLFSQPLLNKDHIVIGLALKRFCIYAQIVNTIIECYYYEHDINIYKKRCNLLLANGLYKFAISHKKQQLVENFESAFICMMRFPSSESIEKFYKLTQNLLSDEDTVPSFRTLLNEIPQTIETVQYAIPRENPFYMDNTVSLFIGILQKWYDKKDTKMDIIFDGSKPIASQKELLEHLRDLNISEIEVGYAKGKHVYPLPMGNIELVKSEDYLGVQIADTIASAVVFIQNNKNLKMRPFQDMLKVLPLFNSPDIFATSLVPSSIEELTQNIDTSKDIDPIDFLCKYMDM